MYKQTKKRCLQQGTKMNRLTNHRGNVLQTVDVILILNTTERAPKKGTGFKREKNENIQE